MSAGALVSFDATAAGNLTWSGNKFTLKANKTYIIEASLAIYAGTPSAARFQIYNYTGSGTSLANGLFISHGGSGTNYPNANTPMKCIVTPTTDIQVGIRLEGSYGAAPGIIGNTSVVGLFASSNVSYFSVQQIGSSAIINPWTLSGTDTYNTIGNVGIGVTSPTDRLVVGSSIALHDGGDKLVGMGWSPGSGKAILTGYPAEIRLNPSTGKLSFGIDPTSRSIGSTAGVERRMTITSSGNIGIGTENPANKLHVQSSDASSVYIESTTSDNNGMVVLNANTGSNWNVNYHEFMIFQKQGTTIGFINAVANSNSVNYSSPSDYRLKTDFKNYGGLDLVNKIKTYDYAWKRDSSRMYGVMAHELQEVLPYLVSGTKDSVDVNGKIIPQAVDYSKLTPILVKAIQEQDVKIKEQEGKILKLKDQKDSIEKRVSDLELLIKKFIEKDN